MYNLLDLLFTFLHIALIGFNLLGWISPQTRKAHFICVELTAFSWFILGIFYGIGYCPLTDWQWQIKEQLGETNLPNSFIKYVTDKVTGKNISASLVDLLTATGFGFSLVMALYFRFKKRI
ncbi:MAG: DUF2784 domain-containing protein [Flavobacterium sp.]|nr:DUF2784 domain-containing protein [Pedobacter sp.]